MVLFQWLNELKKKLKKMEKNNLIKETIRQYTEEITRFSQNKRGEIIVVSKRRLSTDLVSDIAENLGYSFVDQLDGRYEYIIKTPVGKENSAGQDFVDNYPEYFESFYRQDVRGDHVNSELEEVKDLIDDLLDNSYGDYDKGLINSDWNEKIDYILEKLESLKLYDELNERAEKTKSGKKVPSKYLKGLKSKGKMGSKEAMKKEIDQFRGTNNYKPKWDADHDNDGKRIKTKVGAATKAFHKRYGK